MFRVRFRANGTAPHGREIPLARAAPIALGLGQRLGLNNCRSAKSAMMLAFVSLPNPFLGPPVPIPLRHSQSPPPHSIERSALLVENLRCHGAAACPAQPFLQAL